MIVGKQLHTTLIPALVPQVIPVQNDPIASLHQKPKIGTGLWTSTWCEETQNSAWTQYSSACIPTMLGKVWWLLTPHIDAKLFVIDSYSDLKRLLKMHTWSPPHTKSLEGYINPKIFATIDFENLAEIYDGIWLTNKGQQETKITYPFNLSQWDCETILWFHWRFTRVEQVEHSTLQLKTKLC